MKTINLFITTTLLFAINSFGQLDKKIWLVGGTGSFNSYKQENSQTVISEPQNNLIDKKEVFNLEISPKVGYFFIDKLAVGINFTYSNFKIKDINYNSSSNSSRFFAGPFVRYYFLEKEKSFNILTDISYQKEFLNHEYDNTVKTENRFNIMVGPEIFFNSSVGMEFLLGYRIYNIKYVSGDITSSNEQKGFQISIGFQIHLEK